MKPAQDTLRGYEHVFRRPEFVRSAVKYDNRAQLARTLEFWPMAQNSREVVPAVGTEVPTNQALELLAEGYAAGFVR